MEEVLKIIASACLKHSDSGEASFNKEARVILQELENNGYKVVKNIDTSDIVSFAAKHQKEYGKDITFDISTDGKEIIAVMQTVFGKFTGKGSNQKIAKVEAVKLANEAWKDNGN
jgi:hypothetical protein